jgi:hypothetical protein
LRLSNENNVCVSQLPHACYMFHPNNITLRAHIMKFLVVSTCSYYLFTCGLFHDAFSSSYCVASGDRMFDEYELDRIRKEAVVA